MSLTRIKDAFAILKNLVLEARSSSGPSRVDSKEISTDAQRQIEDLRSCLVQRDTEIAILVNMVKKNKGNSYVEERDGDQQVQEFQNRPLTNPEISSNRSDGSELRLAESKLVSGSSVIKKNRPETNLEDKESERESRIVKRHLYGVPPPEDRRIFEDMSGMKLL
jgi:hypothetical protein